MLCYMAYAHECVLWIIQCVNGTNFNIFTPTVPNLQCLPQLIWILQRMYIPTSRSNAHYQWVSGQSDRRRFGDQRQPQHQPYDGERHGRIEWHQHRTFHTNNPHSDESRRRDDMNQPERRRRQPRCWYCYEPGHTYQQCRHKDYVQCGNCGQLGHKSKHCNTESNEY